MTVIEIDTGVLYCRACDSYCDELPNCHKESKMIAVFDSDIVIEYLHPKCHELILNNLKRNNNAIT